MGAQIKSLRVDVATDRRTDDDYSIAAAAGRSEGRDDARYRTLFASSACTRGTLGPP